MPFTTSALHLHRGVSMSTPEVYVLLLNRAHKVTSTVNGSVKATGLQEKVGQAEFA